MNNPYVKYRDKFDIFLQWLRDLGGTYEYLYDDTAPNHKRDNYPPKYQPQLRALNPRVYFVDEHGSVRKHKR